MQVYYGGLTKYLPPSNGFNTLVYHAIVPCSCTGGTICVNINVE